MPVNKSDVIRAVIVKTPTSVKVQMGCLYGLLIMRQFIINKKGNLRETQIFGPIARDFINGSFTKIV